MIINFVKLKFSYGQDIYSSSFGQPLLIEIIDILFNKFLCIINIINIV